MDHKWGKEASNRERGGGTNGAEDARIWTKWLRVEGLGCSNTHLHVFSDHTPLWRKMFPWAVENQRYVAARDEWLSRETPTRGWPLELETAFSLINKSNRAKKNNVNTIRLYFGMQTQESGYHGYDTEVQVWKKWRRKKQDIGDRLILQEIAGIFSISISPIKRWSKYLLIPSFRCGIPSLRKMWVATDKTVMRFWSVFIRWV